MTTTMAFLITWIKTHRPKMAQRAQKNPVLRMKRRHPLELLFARFSSGSKTSSELRKRLGRNEAPAASDISSFFRSFPPIPFRSSSVEPTLPDDFQMSAANHLFDVHTSSSFSISFSVFLSFLLSLFPSNSIFLIVYLLFFGVYSFWQFRRC